LYTLKSKSATFTLTLPFSTEGNLLNWLYYRLKLYENLRNLAALLCAYIKMLLMEMAALI